MTAPNFFIVGAPKGGTTALAQYLSEHADVFISRPKEPAYWNSDHPWSRHIHELHTVDDYLALFSRADPERHVAIGEGSTAYLQSHAAIANIMDFDPAARCIVMLRNPVDVAHGMHGELVRHYREDVDDFEEAWRLQDRRARGEALPAVTLVKHQLQYSDVATFAPQLRRLNAAVPTDQRLVIIFDDFVADPGAVYRQVLAFLGVRDDGRDSFPVVHAARQFRSGLIGRLYMTPPPTLERAVRAIRDRYMHVSPRIRHIVSDRIISRSEPRTALSPDFADELRAHFAADVAETSELLGRDLTGWSVSPGR